MGVGINLRNGRHRDVNRDVKRGFDVVNSYKKLCPIQAIDNFAGRSKIHLTSLNRTFVLEVKRYCTLSRE